MGGLKALFQKAHGAMQEAGRILSLNGLAVPIFVLLAFSAAGPTLAGFGTQWFAGSTAPTVAGVAAKLGAGAGNLTGALSNAAHGIFTPEQLAAAA
jgi:hypothetical protein